MVTEVWRQNSTKSLATHSSKLRQVFKKSTVLKTALLLYFTFCESPNFFSVHLTPVEFQNFKNCRTVVGFLHTYLASIKSWLCVPCISEAKMHVQCYMCMSNVPAIILCLCKAAVLTWLPAVRWMWIDFSSMLITWTLMLLSGPQKVWYVVCGQERKPWQPNLSPVSPGVRRRWGEWKMTSTLINQTTGGSSYGYILKGWETKIASLGSNLKNI